MAPLTEVTFCSPKKVVFEWTSDDNSTSSGTTDKYYSGDIDRVKVTHDPESPPLASYDIVIQDDDGDDLTCSEFKDIAPIEDKLVSSERCVLGAVAGSRLTFIVSGTGGAGKKGTITVYIR